MTKRLTTTLVWSSHKSPVGSGADVEGYVVWPYILILSGCLQLLSRSWTILMLITLFSLTTLLCSPDSLIQAWCLEFWDLTRCKLCRKCTPWLPRCQSNACTPCSWSIPGHQFLKEPSEWFFHGSRTLHVNSSSIWRIAVLHTGDFHCFAENKWRNRSSLGKTTVTCNSPVVKSFKPDN